jgi:hypothetical protein
MSKHHRHHNASHGAEQNAPTTELTVQPPQEKTMPENTQDQMEASPEASQEATGPTAKQMAAAEEANQTRVLKLAAQADAPPPQEAVPLADVAARGYDALHEAFRRHNENNKPKEYVPPPRTARQMSVLEEELEAGRRTQQKAQAQQDASRPVPPDGNKEGFTTPVYRPGDVVPDPTIPAKPGYGLGGTRQYGADAP